MGYTTRYHGTLNFGDITISELRHLNQLLEMDPDDENGPPSYIGVKLNTEMTGLVDNGDEKIYDMDKTINWLERRMHEVNPSFKLTGHFNWSGEDGAIGRVERNGLGEFKEFAIDPSQLYKEATQAGQWKEVWDILDKSEMGLRDTYGREYEIQMRKAFDAIRANIRD